MPARPVHARLIKRYPNRKLYDADGRRYVAIEDIARLITSGEDVVVQDQKSGRDITSVVLAQVILDGVKARAESIPRQVLTRLIRLGSGPVSAWADWDGPQEAAARARTEAERIASDLSASVQQLVAEAQGSVESRLRRWLPAAPPPRGARARGRAMKTTQRKRRTR
jgi:polyhydroxyalkanoate synthesis repressor PhaR